MAKITIDRGSGKGKLSAEVIRSIDDGITEALEKLGDNEQMVKVITVQQWGYKGGKEYLKIKIVLTEPALDLGKPVEFEDELFATDDTVAHVSEQITLKIIHMGSVRDGQHQRLAKHWEGLMAQIMEK